MKPEFEFLRTSKNRRRSPVGRRWSWPRFWLAFSGGALLLIGSVALLKAIRGSLHDQGEIDSGEGRQAEFFQPPASQKRRPDLLGERPADRPTPEAVNAFLREEEALNSSRLDLLRQRQVKVERVDFSSHCLPEWDFRSFKREVIWFYHYRSGMTEAGRPLTVFGAVDGLGQPLFQHPPMAGDPLAILDSQYLALKWITLEEPRMALIAASNGPWPESGAVIDVFRVSAPAAQTGPRFWRFDDASYPERPPTSARMICFQDADGDGLRDLCAFWQSGEAVELRSEAVWHRFVPELQSFSSTRNLASASVTRTLEADYSRILSGEALGGRYLMAAPATERIFPLEPAPLDEVPSEEQPAT